MKVQVMHQVIELMLHQCINMLQDSDLMHRQNEVMKQDDYCFFSL
jgi:hypothetical protein